MIQVENLYFTHSFSDQPTLKGLNLKVEKGSITALTGESGCGKTTLMMVLLGLAPEFIKGKIAGNISVAGEREPSRFRRHIEPVFQNPDTQLFSLRVIDEVVSQLEKIGMSKTDATKEAARVLDQFRIGNLAARKTDTLSWGEKQKLALACAVAPKPEVLLLDEPLSGLDPVSREVYLGEIKRINREFGSTVVIVEHEIEQIMEFADRLYVINDGRLEDIAEKTDESDMERIEKYLPVGASGAVVELKKAGHSYSKRTKAMAPMDVKLRRGERLAVLGPNGAGKSTMAKCSCALMKPSEGEVFLFEKNAKRVPRKDIARRTGYTFQNPDRQLFSSTVRDECLFASKNFGIHGPDAESRLSEISEALGISRLMDRMPLTLSQGEKKRVALASAFAHAPEVVALDEPVAGLDRLSARKVASFLKETCGKETALLFITHDIGLVRALATRVVFLRSGRKVFDGEVRDFFSSDWREMYVEESC